VQAAITRNDPHHCLVEVAVGGGHEQLEDDIAVTVILGVHSHLLHRTRSQLLVLQVQMKEL